MTNEAENQRADLARALADAGWTDVLIVSHDTAARLLSDRKQELLQHLQREEMNSITDLSEALGRDPAMVSKDLDLLFEYDVIAFEQDGPRKIPRLKHDYVLAEPLV